MMDIEILVRADSAISSYGISEQSLYQEQSLRQTFSWKYSRRKIIRNLLIVSICTTIVQSVRKCFSQNQSSIQILQLVQTMFPYLKINQTFINLIEFFIVFLNSIAVPQLIISRLSSKYAILISIVSYFILSAVDIFNSNQFTVIGEKNYL